ncbi:MAG: hypothetical protein ACKOF9_07070 [Burkholderiales bacterium]
MMISFRNGDLAANLLMQPDEALTVRPELVEGSREKPGFRQGI